MAFRKMLTCILQVWINSTFFYTNIVADISKFTKLTLIFISYFKMHATFNNSALCSLKHEKYLLLLRFSMCKKWHFISEKSCLKSIRHDWEPILNQKFYFHYLALNKTTFF